MTPKLGFGEYMARRRRLAVERGDCSRCAIRKATKGRTTCTRCREAHKAQYRARVAAVRA